MDEIEIRPERKRQLAGGFAHMTAPFAVHPADKKRAKLAVSLDKVAGVSRDEFVAAARDYLVNAQCWPTDVDEQLDLVRDFVGKKLD